jgi:hypothetical protein
MSSSWIPVAVITLVCHIQVADSAPQAKPNESLAAIKARITRGDEAAIRELATLPKEEAVMALAGAVRLYSWSAQREQYPTFAAVAAEVLAGIEGHGAVLRDEILIETAERPLDNRRFVLFDVLSEIKSHEVIDILGEFLNGSHDPVLSRELIASGVGPPESNAFLAARALGRMGLENPPITKNPETYRFEDIAKWKIWRDGNKDNIEDLLAPAQTLQPPQISFPPSTEKPPTPTEAPEAEKPTALLYVVLGLLVVAVVVVALQKARKP